MPTELNLPRPPFLWTIDQIAALIRMDQLKLETTLIHYQRLTVGPTSRDKITAHNIAPLGEDAEWRVSESELTRWLHAKGFRARYNHLF